MSWNKEKTVPKKEKIDAEININEMPKDENGYIMLGGTHICFFCNKKFISSRLKDKSKCPNCGNKLTGQR